MRLRPCALLLLLLICPAIAAANPAITIDSPASHSFTKSDLVKATVTGTGTLAVTMNGVTAAVDPNDPNHPNTFLAHVPLTTQDPLDPNNSTVTVDATDDDGPSSASVTFTFDDQVPVIDVQLVSPPITDPNTTTGFASLRIVGSMSDNDPNASRVVRVRGFSRPLVPSASGFDQRVELARGGNPIVFTATDRAGNTVTRVFQITRTIVCQDPNFPISDPNAIPTTYFVDRTDDLPDPIPDDGICDVRPDLRGDPDPNNPPFTPPIRHCTLRAAIQTANRHSGDDKIQLGNAVYVLTRERVAGDAEGDASGDLDITENLRIVGAGRDSTIIDARKLGDRVFDVADGVHLQLLSLSIGGGRTPKPADPNDAEGGGCLRSRGPLQANNVAVLSCKSDGPGGALSLEDPNASATLTCAVVARSQSKTDGGAIAVDGAPLTLRNSALSLNSAGRRGGAVSMIGGEDPLALVLKNVTVSQNKSKLAGGALDLGASVTATINNCTFANNVAKAGATLSTTNDGNALISNSILGDKSKLACDPNSPEPVVSMGGNVERDETCLVSPTADDLVNVDPKLDKLATNNASNGTPTHALKLGSLAIDFAGRQTPCEPLDARDVERGDFPRTDNPPDSSTASPPFCDSGALELFVQPLP
jgi:hypothetical protein